MPNHAPTYTWECRYCNRVNAPGVAEHCQYCGFPANSSADDLELAKTAGSPDVVIEQHAKSAASEESPWARVLVWIFGIIFIIGLLLARLAGPIEWNFIGLAIAAVPFAMLWIWKRHKERANRAV